MTAQQLIKLAALAARGKLVTDWPSERVAMAVLRAVADHIELSTPPADASAEIRRLADAIEETYGDQRFSAETVLFDRTADAGGWG
jgi:hypothetical protein